MEKNEIKIEEIKDEVEDYSIKFVIVGNSGVGKSNMLSRFVNNDFSSDTRATVGVELSTKTYKINNKVVKIHLWDTAGQERYKSITGAYYKGAKGAVIVYDITNKESFDNVDKWLKEIRELAGKNVNVIVCGNKSDLENQRTVSKQDLSQKGEMNNLITIETSALNSSNVEKAFRLLLTEVYNSSIKQEVKVQEEAFTKVEMLKVESRKLDGMKKNGCC